MLKSALPSSAAHVTSEIRLLTHSKSGWRGQGIGESWLAKDTEFVLSDATLISSRRLRGAIMKVAGSWVCFYAGLELL